MTDPRDHMSRRRLLSMGGGVLGAALVSGLGSSAAATPTAGVPGVQLPPIDLGDPWHAPVDAAGYVPKTATIGDVTLSYVEGPVNGPPLVLLHAQHMDWFSYSRVLPALAASFHVFDVDYHGHGPTVTPSDYPMNANRIGADLAIFLEDVVGEPAFVTGNSSGGLLTTWLAANRPDLVRSVLLEDPPLFASEYPRIAKTIADRSFATSRRAVEQHVDDFLLYWIHDSKPFFDKNVFPGSDVVLTEAVKLQRLAQPGRPVEIGILPNDIIKLLLRGLDHQYDPRFGAAFHDGTWNAGFDHAEALAAIECPALLVHANYSWVDGDVLNGAMSQEDADRAASLLPNGTYHRIDAEHVTHLDEPEEFLRILENFFLDRTP